MAFIYTPGGSICQTISISLNSYQHSTLFSVELDPILFPSILRKIVQGRVRWRERPERRARVAATEPALRDGTADGRREKMVNKYAAMI